MTKKKEKTTLEILMEKSVCVYCGKKKCHNKCRTEWDKRMLDIELAGYAFEDIEYKLRKTRDSLDEAFECLNEQIENNKTMQNGMKKQKPKPVKKTG